MNAARLPVAMALFSPGITRCSICGHVVDAAPDVVGLAEFPTPPGDPLERFLDSIMHGACYETWPMRASFEARHEKWEEAISTPRVFDDAGLFRPTIPLPCATAINAELNRPGSGRHVCASFDEATIVVYQAYKPAIAAHAVATQTLGGPDFSFNRMSWIKPNFLWMMYRSGWGTKPDQEHTLGLRIRRPFFDELLARAVESSFSSSRHSDDATWRAALAASDVRLQWDPDHDPRGRPLERRAVQLGLRGESLRRLATTDLVEVIDLTAFVAEQRRRLESRSEELVVPIERVYRPSDPAAAANARLDAPP